MNVCFKYVCLSASVVCLLCNVNKPIIGNNKTRRCKKAMCFVKYSEENSIFRKSLIGRRKGGWVGNYLSLSGRGRGWEGRGWGGGSLFEVGANSRLGASLNFNGMLGFCNSISLYYKVAYSLGKIVLGNEVVGSVQSLIVISYFRLQSVGS